MKLRKIDPITKERACPNENPTMSSVRFALSQDEQHKLDDVRGAFGTGMFKGKLVVQWCGRCGKWRPQYVPQSKLDEMAAAQKARPYFTQEPDTFPCMKCNRKLVLCTDSDNTILETK